MSESESHRGTAAAGAAAGPEARAPGPVATGWHSDSGWPGGPSTVALAAAGTVTRHGHGGDLASDFHDDPSHWHRHTPPGGPAPRPPGGAQGCYQDSDARAGPAGRPGLAGPGPSGPNDSDFHRAPPSR